MSMRAASLACLVRRFGHGLSTQTTVTGGKSASRSSPWLAPSDIRSLSRRVDRQCGLSSALCQQHPRTPAASVHLWLLHYSRLQTALKLNLPPSFISSTEHLHTKAHDKESNLSFSNTL